MCYICHKVIKPEMSLRMYLIKIIQYPILALSLREHENRVFSRNGQKGI